MPSSPAVPALGTAVVLPTSPFARSGPAVTHPAPPLPPRCTAGSYSAVIVSEHGHELDSLDLPELPAEPLVLADFNFDGYTDIILLGRVRLCTCAPQPCQLKSCPGQGPNESSACGPCPPACMHYLHAVCMLVRAWGTVGNR